MSDESSGSTPAEGEAAGTQGQVMLERLYLKDASFESPRSPAVFTETWKPEFQLDINTRTSSLGEDRFEVSIGEQPGVGGSDVWLVFFDRRHTTDIARGENRGRRLDHHNVVRELCPGTLFPYVRETVDSLVVKGGFPAVHLAPVNFEALYAEARRKHTDESGTPTQH
jgi:preprotein translocase subunit SecB